MANDPASLPAPIPLPVQSRRRRMIALAQANGEWLDWQADVMLSTVPGLLRGPLLHTLKSITHGQVTRQNPGQAVTHALESITDEQFDAWYTGLMQFLVELE